MRSPLRNPAPVVFALLAALSAAGCDGTVEPVFTVDADLSEVIPTVVTVRWTLDGTVDAAHVEFGPDTDYGTRIEATVDADGGYSALLLGNPPAQEVHFRAVAVVDGESLYSDDCSVVTGSQPTSLPEVLTSDEHPSMSAGGFLVTSVMAIPTTAAVLDEQGRYVWWYGNEDAETADWPITRTRLSRDGTSMLILHNVPLGEDTDLEEQYILRVALDGSHVQTIPTDDVHNDFVELPDGTLALLAEDVHEVDGEPVIGDRIVELRPDGSEVEIWSVWDDLEFDPSGTAAELGYWTHANALDYDEDEDVYYVGARHVHTIFKVQRGSGELLWMFGGEASDFTLAVGEPTALQHQFQVLDDGLLVFDNREESEFSSRAVQYALDHDDGSAEEVWEYISEPPVYCYGMGDVTRLDSGNTLVTWSTSGMLDEVSPEGELLWRIRLELGGGLAYVTRVDSLYADPAAVR